jgi:hypothetical protein
MSNELQKLLRENDRYWLKELTKPPYNLSIKNDGNLYIFKYNQINSDFSNKIVQEARGIIFDRDDNWRCVCRAFDKFFNLGESNAHPINWKTAVAQEKIDGSIVKIWNYKGKEVISTNGTIDANNAQLQVPFVDEETGLEVDNYFQLALFTLKKMFSNGKDWSEKMGELFSKFDSKATQIFELCTPYNKIVVPHKDFKLYYLGSRENESGIEYYNIDIAQMMPTPRQYAFFTKDEVIERASNLPYDQEGYVVVDDKYNRIKVKSPAYVAIHHLRGEGVPSEKRILDLVRSGEDEEFLQYFPEYEELYRRVKKKWSNLLNRIFADVQTYKELYEKADRKDLALWATYNCLIPAIIFSLKDGKIKNSYEFLEQQSSEKLLKWMKGL